MITKEQVKHIGKLSRIKLTKEEVERYQEDLSQVLDYFEILKEANVEDVPPMTHALLHGNVAREDIPEKEQSNVIAALTKLAPTLQDGFLKVKTILSFK
jgi:aspartyl-tRNA(Asn)/glutamyl-tRNA(Gln) amidotransferase subunit C